jgi:hypothetical protein
LLDPCASPADTHDDEVTGTEVAGALAVDRNGDVRDEVRLADELLAPLVDFDD